MTTIVFPDDSGYCRTGGFAAGPYYLSIDGTGTIYTLAPFTSVIGAAPELDIVSDGGVTALLTASQQPKMDGLAVTAAGTVFLSIESADGYDQVFMVSGSNVLIHAGDVGSCDDTGSDAGAGVDGVEGMVADWDGGLYIADSHTHRANCAKIRRVDPDGTISTLSGQGPEGYQDGPGAGAEFANPTGIALANGVIYVVDEFNGTIRTVTQDGTTHTIAGDPYTSPGYMDGPGELAQFNGPNGVAVDSLGNVYVADTQNNRIRMIDPSGNVSTLAGNGTRGFADGTLGADGGAQFNRPEGVAIDPAGNLWVADTFNCSLREIILPSR